MNYQLAAAEIFLIDVPFRFRFRHAAADRGANQTLLVRLTSSDGTVGWGEGLTRPYLTGETPETVFSAVERWWPALKALRFGADFPDRLLRPEWERADREHQTAAWALIDVGCYDLWLRAGGRLPAGAVSVPVTFPFGLTGGKIMPRLAHLRGFRRIKIKVTGNLPATRAAIAAAGNGWEHVGIDANGSFPASELGALIGLLRAEKIDVIEQPFPRTDVAGAAALVRAQTARVVADESLCTAGDARALISAQAADVFNIRLAKNGGVTGALELAALAAAGGIGIQLGALVGESDLLANAARFVLPLIKPDLHEYSFPGILLRRSFVRSDLPRFSPQLAGADFSGRGFGVVNEVAVRRAAVRSLRLG
jgi:muconate cycloisomerase